MQPDLTTSGHFAILTYVSFADIWNGGDKPMGLRDQMRKGSSELIILSLLLDETKYGYQITQELHDRSGGYFDMKEGLLYPTLHRMERDGLVSSEWLTVVGKRRRKYYRVTDLGRQALTNQTREWRAFTERLMGLLDSPTSAPEGAG